jgi:hypothetical protein
MGVHEHYSINVAHVMLNINTIESIDEGQLCLGYIYALSGACGFDLFMLICLLYCPHLIYPTCTSS